MDVLASQWSLVDRIEFYSDPRMTPDETRLYEGGYYPILLQKPSSLIWSRWQWKGDHSERVKTQLEIFPNVPFHAQGDDRRILELACHYWIPLMGYRIRTRTVVERETSQFKLNWAPHDCPYDE